MKWIRIVVLIVIFSMLFMSSSQSYEQQSLVSELENWLPGKPLESLLATLEIPYWGIKVSIAERGYYEFVEFLIRKSAHFFTFGLMALVIYAVLPKWNFRKVIAVFLTLLVAISDEVHQSLTAGRTASSQDVILDMAGAVTVLILLHFLISVKHSTTQKKSTKEL